MCQSGSFHGIFSNGLAIVYIRPVTRAIPMILSHNPALHICAIVTWPEPKTIALGGVATGIMNA